MPLRVPEQAYYGLVVLAVLGLVLVLVGARGRFVVRRGTLRHLGAMLMCGSLIGIAVTGTLDAFQPVPAPADLLPISGSLRSLTVERRGRDVRMRLTLDEDPSVWEFNGPNEDELRAQLQVGHVVDLLVIPPGGPRSYLDSDVWEIRQDGRVLVSHNEVIGFIRPRQIASVVMGICIALVGLAGYWSFRTIRHWG